MKGECGSLDRLRRAKGRDGVPPDTRAGSGVRASSMLLAVFLLANVLPSGEEAPSRWDLALNVAGAALGGIAVAATAGATRWVASSGGGGRG